MQFLQANAGLVLRYVTRLHFQTSCSSPQIPLPHTFRPLRSVHQLTNIQRAVRGKQLFLPAGSSEICRTGRSPFTRIIFGRFRFNGTEHLEHLSNSHYNFRFQAIWHRRSAVALNFCIRLAECDVTVTVACMNLLRW